jgi:GDP-L-fucose synthase
VLELAKLIKEVAGYPGKIVLDETKPDGAPYKTMDNSRLKKVFLWVPTTDLRMGIEKTVRWYLRNIKRGNK